MASPISRFPSLKFFVIDLNSSLVKTFHDGGTNAAAEGLEILRDLLRFLLRLYTRSHMTRARVMKRINPLTAARMIKYSLWQCLWEHLLSVINQNCTLVKVVAVLNKIPNTSNIESSKTRQKTKTKIFRIMH